MKRLVFVVAPLVVSGLVIAAVVVAQQPTRPKFGTPNFSGPTPANKDSSGPRVRFGDPPSLAQPASNANADESFAVPASGYPVPSGNSLAPPPIPASPEQQWKMKFTRVANEIVELLDEEELEVEFAKLTKRASELTARRKLREAIEGLKGIIELHPDTEAAATAKELLEQQAEPGDEPAGEAAGEGDYDSSEELGEAGESE